MPDGIEKADDIKRADDIIKGDGNCGYYSLALGVIYAVKKSYLEDKTCPEEEGYVIPDELVDAYNSVFNKQPSQTIKKDDLKNIILRTTVWTGRDLVQPDKNKKSYSELVYTLGLAVEQYCIDQGDITKEFCDGDALLGKVDGWLTDDLFGALVQDKYLKLSSYLQVVYPDSNFIEKCRKERQEITDKYKSIFNKENQGYKRYIDALHEKISKNMKYDAFRKILGQYNESLGGNIKKLENLEQKDFNELLQLHQTKSNIIREYHDEKDNTTNISRLNYESKHCIDKIGSDQESNKLFIYYKGNHFSPMVGACKEDNEKLKKLFTPVLDETLSKDTIAQKEKALKANQVDTEAEEDPVLDKGSALNITSSPNNPTKESTTVSDSITDHDHLDITSNNDSDSPHDKLSSAPNKDLWAAYVEVIEQYETDKKIYKLEINQDEFKASYAFPGADGALQTTSLSGSKFTVSPLISGQYKGIDAVCEAMKNQEKSNIEVTIHYTFTPDKIEGFANMVKHLDKDCNVKMGRITLGQGQDVDAIINALRDNKSVPDKLITQIENGLKSKKQGVYPPKYTQPPAPQGGDGRNAQDHKQSSVIVTPRLTQ